MLSSASSFCLEKEKEEMIVLKTREGDFAYIPFQRYEAAAFENTLLRGRADDLSSEVDDMSAKIQHMVPRSELELEKRRVAKWKRRADERRLCANRYNKDVCALEDKLESSHRCFRNLVRRTNKHVRADRHRSKVAFTARVKEKKLRKSLVRSRHSVSMENQRVRAENASVSMENQRLMAENAALKGEGTSRAIGGVRRVDPFTLRFLQAFSGTAA